jgi:hypothetical protein
MSPFVGVLMGPDADADFVLVGIGSSAEVRPFTSPHTVICPRLFWTASIPRNCTEAGSFIHFNTPVTTASC